MAPKSRFTKKERRQLDELFQNLENEAIRLVAFAESLVKDPRTPEFLGSRKYPQWRRFLK